ncbi:MAG: Arm DNA-binding domain-containing protein [Thermoleophilia bacterium]|nr:Arm DNA-binding domain-containing protein [Thermoleophilia bacterium]
MRRRGTWEYILELGDRPTQRCTGCNHRHWVDRTRLKSCVKCGGPLVDRVERRQQVKTGFKTKKDAEAALNDALSSLGQGTYVAPAKLTVEEFLRDEWLPAVKSSIRESTYLSYKGHVEGHIIPLLGPERLQRLSGSMINAFYATLLSEPEPEEPKDKVAKTRTDTRTKTPKKKPTTETRKKKLSPTTVRHVHGTLHKALKDAVRWDRLPRNPIEAANPPKRMSAGSAEMQVWTSAELKTFLSGGAVVSALPTLAPPRLHRHAPRGGRGATLEGRGSQGGETVGTPNPRLRRLRGPGIRTQDP